MSRYEQTHPSYDRRLLDWLTVEDCYQGETQVKSRTTQYLPMTSGQKALGTGWSGGIKNAGQELYDAYVLRAVFPEIVKATAQALVGLAVREQWNVELPDSLAYLKQRATDTGATLDDLIAYVLEQVIRTGRCGLLPDVRADNTAYLATYVAAQIQNWDNTPADPQSGERDLTLVVLNESRKERDPETWQWSEVKRYRALILAEGVYTRLLSVDGAELPAVVPQLRGTSLPKIPFVFINAGDLDPEAGEVPLRGLASIALTAYRGEADHRQALFMQGQDTLVLRGVAKPSGMDDDSQIVVGAGAAIYLPDPDMDAKYIGVESSGLVEMRLTVNEDYKRGEQYGVALLTSGADAEAAETIKTRMSARTASLAMIVKTGAAGIEDALKTIAEWSGEDPDSVKVEPNLDFVDSPMAAKELLELIAAKSQGMPLAWRTIHGLAKKGDLTPLDYDDELELIDDEPASGRDPAVGEVDDDGNDQ